MNYVIMPFTKLVDICYSTQLQCKLLRDFNLSTFINFASLYIYSCFTKMTV